MNTKKDVLYIDKGNKGSILFFFFCIPWLRVIACNKINYSTWIHAFDYITHALHTVQCHSREQEVNLLPGVACTNGQAGVACKRWEQNMFSPLLYTDYSIHNVREFLFHFIIQSMLHSQASDEGTSASSGLCLLIYTCYSHLIHGWQ